MTPECNHPSWDYGAAGECICNNCGAEIAYSHDKYFPVGLTLESQEDPNELLKEIL